MNLSQLGYNGALDSSRGGAKGGVEERYPTLAAIPAMQRRRLSGLAKLAIQSALQSLAGGGVDYIVWASQYGDEAKTLSILHDVLSDQIPSPTAFSTSVHNAIAGLYSILLQDATPSTSLCATWSEALIEAYAYLVSHTAGHEASQRISHSTARVLVVYYDEPLPVLYQDHQAFEGFALAAVLSLAHPNFALTPQLISKQPFKYQDALDFYQFWQQADQQQLQAWSKC
ncbi:beta-ketoacyl synthase-like protein [Acinetobacter calcoaceticus]|uniref:Beta-ketoacyl synthase-like protein n=1 Tax=Acinetobacter calcoaceticus TaxID=471 RepID=A0A4R1XH97_ACICA|nr:beta-ketoacyl synthase-like protein [Acinetobacter calcoaceticus]